MQEYSYSSDKELNKSLLKDVLGMPKWWLAAFGSLLLVWLTGMGAYGWELNPVSYTHLTLPTNREV